MTCKRTTLNLVLRACAIPIGGFLFYVWSDAPDTALMIVGPLLAFYAWSDFRKRSTLTQTEDGTYVWIEWHGGVGSSETDPSEPGGEWDSDGDGDGGD